MLFRQAAIYLMAACLLFVGANIAPPPYQAESSKGKVLILTVGIESRKDQISMQAPKT
jgi:hypothetical protein